MLHNYYHSLDVYRKHDCNTSLVRFQNCTNNKFYSSQMHTTSCSQYSVESVGSHYCQWYIPALGTVFKRILYTWSLHYTSNIIPFGEPYVWFLIQLCYLLILSLRGFNKCNSIIWEIIYFCNTNTNICLSVASRRLSCKLRWKLT